MWVEHDLEAVRVACAEFRRAETQLRVAAAKRRRAMLAAYRAGRTQDEVAAAAGVSRQAAGKMIRRGAGG